MLLDLLSVVARGRGKGETKQSYVDTALNAALSSQQSGWLFAEKPAEIANSRVARSALLEIFPKPTPGALAAISKEKTLLGATKVLLSDRNVKAFIRDVGARRNALEQANRLIREAWAVELAGTPVAPGLSEELPVDLPSGLRRFWSNSYRVRVGGVEQQVLFGEVATRILKGEAFESLPVLTALAGSDANLAVLLLRRALNRTPGIDESAYLAVNIASVRAFSTFNAHASAYKCGIEAENAAETLGLPPVERTKLELLIARAAARSGNALEAGRRYRSRYLSHPKKTEHLVNWLFSVHVDQPDLAAHLAESIVTNKMELSPGAILFAGEILLAGGRPDRSMVAITRLLSEQPNNAEARLAFANYSLALGDTSGWVEGLRTYGQMKGLRFESVHASTDPAVFWFKQTATPALDGPLVTVVMTTFNAAETVRPAIDSVLQQKHGNLELIVVDDCSVDRTRDIVADIAAADPRVTLLPNSENTGTYVSKNRAVGISKGKYVTFHDSDDWMHPDRLTEHVSAMETAPDLMCTTSEWLRMEKTGRITPRPGSDYTHLNPASTFLRREAFDSLGGFDEVRTGADAEFLTRARLIFGSSAVRSLGKCLTLGLTHEGSLTTSGVAAFDPHRYSPVRLAYTESWLDWHLRAIEEGTSLKLEPGKPRAFPAPAPIDARSGSGRSLSQLPTDGEQI